MAAMSAPVWLHKRFRPEFTRLAREAYPCLRSADEAALLALATMSTELWREVMTRIQAMPAEERPLSPDFLAAMAFMRLGGEICRELEQITKPAGVTTQ